MSIAVSMFVSRNKGTANPIIIESGTLCLRVLGPFCAILGILLQIRNALQGLGRKWIPLISSTMEFIGKIIFTILLVPRFQYTAVVLCEPIIWCVMVVQLLYSLYRDPYMKIEK